MITIEILQKLFISSGADLTRLKGYYDLLPVTRCKRKTHCCKMLPEITLLEALAAFKRLEQETAERRQRIVEKIITYFFINPAKITACPFLEKRQCIIYEDRFFGCRAYGLWSSQHYAKMAKQNRLAKRKLGQQWHRLGITLPKEVVEFQTPYCLDVEIIDGTLIDDKALVQIATDIENLSDRLSPWHRSFNQLYFADLSFMTTAMIFEVSQALHKKVEIVRDFISAGSSKILAASLENIPDILKTNAILG
jgi:hypothetical protein